MFSGKNTEFFRKISVSQNWNGFSTLNSSFMSPAIFLSEDTAKYRNFRGTPPFYINAIVLKRRNDKRLVLRKNMFTHSWPNQVRLSV